jgi:hypothetical protein
VRETLKMTLPTGKKDFYRTSPRDIKSNALRCIDFGWKDIQAM